MPTKYGSVPTTEGEEETKSSFQKRRRCNDVLFSLAFLAHVGVIVASWITYEPAGGGEEGSEVEDFADRGVWKFVGTCGAIALILSTLTLFFMYWFSDEIVEIALVVSLLCTAAVTGYGVYIWKIYMMVVGGVAFLAALIFTCHVWKKIPVSLFRTTFNDRRQKGRVFQVVALIHRKTSPCTHVLPFSTPSLPPPISKQPSAPYGPTLASSYWPTYWKLLPLGG